MATLTEDQINTKVEVTYPDGKGNHVTTIGELRTRFQEESNSWKEKFFTHLFSKEIAHSRFGEYKILKVS